MRGSCLAPALLAVLVHAKDEEGGFSTLFGKNTPCKVLTFFFSDVKGRFLNPLNEDQAAAVTAGAVGLGFGVLGAVVVGKLVEDRANCGPLQHGAAGLLPGFLGALQDPRCRGARVQHSSDNHATSHQYQNPQANYQVPALPSQYTPVEKFPATVNTFSSSQYQSPSSFTGPANQYPSPQIEIQYQFTPEAAQISQQYPDLGPILNYKPDGQYPATVPILSSQYQGPGQFQASPEYHQGNSNYQGNSQYEPLIEKDSSGFKAPDSTSRPSAAQFSFGLPARPSGDLVEEEGFLTYSSSGDLVQESYTTNNNKIPDTTSIDFFDLTPNPAIQPRTKPKTEILAEESDAVHFPGAHVRVPRQRSWQSGFQQTVAQKATVDFPIQEEREGRSQSGFQQTGFQQTAPHKATVVKHREWPGIQGRSSSHSRRSVDNRAPPMQLECPITSESHAQCVGQEDGTACLKKCKKPDCLAAVCCSGCCKRSDPNTDSQCGKKKIFEVEILDV